jgi:hypothetical protein
MTKTNDQIANLDAELDALSSPTTADTYVVSKDYDPDVVAASAARRSLAAGGGGGGAAPITRGVYTGGSVHVNSFGTGFLTLTDLDTGDALLNITTPDSPTVVADGTYAFSVYGRADADMTEGAGWDLIIVLAGTVDDVLIRHTSAPATVNIPIPFVHVSATWYLPAGSGVSVKAHNADDAANDFSIYQLYVQRLS